MQMKKSLRKLADAIQRELNRMLKEGTVKRRRLAEDQRPKGKRGQAPYLYSLVKR